MSDGRIVVRLIGGLGNQMFQYAAARAAALRTGSDLVLDTRAYDRGGPTAYALHRFRIDAHIGSAAELPPGRDRPLRYAAWRQFGRSPRFVRERGLGFNPNILNPGDDVYLHGYFQSERYFADFANRIRQDLEFVAPPNGENTRWLDAIRAEEHAVSLHVRRGDYVSDTKSQGAHGTCSAGYYASAFAHLRAAVGGRLALFVFSDDPDWAEANLSFNAPMHVARHNGRSTAHEDLRLMAACRHHIIANSTLSWWGAWLDALPDKIVVAPERWFADPELSNPDIVPPGWKQVGG